jgi:hypothetical protein
VGFVGMGASNSSGKLLNPHVAEKSIHEFTVKVSEAQSIHTYIHTLQKQSRSAMENKQLIHPSALFLFF